MLNDVKINGKEPAAIDIVEIANLAKEYESYYKRHGKKQKMQEPHMGMAKKVMKLAKVILEAEKTGKCIDGLEDMKHMVKRIGRYHADGTKEEKDVYERKYTDKKTLKLIETVEAKYMKNVKSYKDKCDSNSLKINKNIYFKDHKVHSDGDDIKIYKPVIDEGRGNKWIDGHNLRNVRDTIFENIDKIKDSKIRNKYNPISDEKKHNARIEKIRGENNTEKRGEEILESLYCITIPEEIRSKFSEKDLKIFSDHIKKMRDSLEEAKQYNVEIEEYKIAEERTEDAKKEIKDIIDVPRKFREKIDKSIEKHKVKLGKDKQKVLDKKEKCEEKNGIGTEIATANKYNRLLKLHEKWSGKTISEETIEAVTNANSEIFSYNQGKIKEDRIPSLRHENNEAEKDMGALNAEVDVFYEEKRVREEYHKLLENYVAYTIQKAKDKNKGDIKLLSAGDKERTKEDFIKETNANVAKQVKEREVKGIPNGIAKRKIENEKVHDSLEEI